MAEFGGTGFLGAIGGILAGIRSFLGGILGINTASLLRLVRYLRDHLVCIAKDLLRGLWNGAKGLGRALRSLGVLAFHGLKKFVLWADRKLRMLEAWLKDKFKPLLLKLKEIKKHIDDFYKTFIRPIIDTIEFIRQINRVLQVFHINLLRKLDSTLQQIERRVEQPFLWAEEQINRLNNWIDRIVGLDGLFQKLTLIESMSKYAPTWIRNFWNDQAQPAGRVGPPAGRGGDYPNHEVLEDVNALTDYFVREDGDHAGVIRELAANFAIALRTVPDRPP